MENITYPIYVGNYDLVAAELVRRNLFGSDSIGELIGRGSGLEKELKIQKGDKKIKPKENNYKK